MSEIREIYQVINVKGKDARFPEILYSTYDSSDAVRYRDVCHAYDPSEEYMVKTVTREYLLETAATLYKNGWLETDREIFDDMVEYLDELVREQLFLRIKELEVENSEMPCFA